MYIMVPYKLKVKNVEDDKINFSPIRQNIKYCPRKDNNCGDESSMVILDDGQLRGPVIYENIDIISNKIP